MIQHSEVLLTCIKEQYDFKTFVLSILEWLLKTGFTVAKSSALLHNPFDDIKLLKTKLSQLNMGAELWALPSSSVSPLRWYICTLSSVLCLFKR